MDPNDIDFNIPEELKQLPETPGVYIMHDAQDTIIYVGKAINLKNRVRSYFRESTKRTAKIQKMVSLIARFEYIITDSELEALVLENNLIKEHSPKYNTMLKDDKTYPYIKVTVGDAFPKIMVSREMRKDKSRYFGPFTSSTSVNNTIDLLNRLYSLRTCNKVLPRDIGKDRPCLNYQMKQCSAPCNGCIGEQEYRERVNQALDFLNGNYAPLIRSLEEKMQAASQALEFEEAMKYRDLLFSVKAVAQKQKITDSEGENKDIIGMARVDNDVVMQIFFVREGKIIGREHFYMKQTEEESNEAVLDSFLKQFYAGTPMIPREILTPYDFEERELLETWLSGRREGKVRIVVPQKGRKEKLLSLACDNAALILNRDREKLKKEEKKTLGAVRQIAELLHIENADRMEAFDISNISGFANVGSMVVFENGKPKKSDYRKFRIKSVSGPDDYACMYEVLSRRFRHGLEERQHEDELTGSFTRFPDLILMDGGKGQVNVALRVLQELDIHIPVCGMVKDDNHNTRGIYYNNVELPISQHSEGFYLVTRIQDEAHRFAIEFHRSLRRKSQVHSMLEEIPGIGPSRRKALMRSFASIEELKEASVERLSKVDGINASAAEGIYQYFHKEEQESIVDSTTPAQDNE